jgi:hypothetical protein
LFLCNTKSARKEAAEEREKQAFSRGPMRISIQRMYDARAPSLRLLHLCSAMKQTQDANTDREVSKTAANKI